MDKQRTATVWHQTACILCYVNCGIEVMTEGRRLRACAATTQTRVRRATSARRRSGSICTEPRGPADHAAPASCRRQLRADHWDTAVTEIAQRLTQIRGEPRQQRHRLLRRRRPGQSPRRRLLLVAPPSVGVTNYYNALSQEKTGDFWVNGLLFGAQTVPLPRTWSTAICWSSSAVIRGSRTASVRAQPCQRN